MKHLNAIVFIFFVFNLCAQKDAIMKDPNIIWAAEVESDYIIDDYKKAEEREPNRIYTLKLLGIENTLRDNSENYLIERIAKAVFSNNIKIYANSDLKIKTDSFALIRMDTVMGCDGPIDAKPMIFTNHLNIYDIYEYRMKYLIYYDSKKCNWNVNVLAIAPLMDMMDDLGNFSHKNPLFWINVYNSNSKLHSKDIVWAKRITSAKNSINLSQIKPFKSSNINPVVHLINAINEKPKLSLYSHDYSEKRKLSLEEKLNIISPKDFTDYNNQKRFNQNSTNPLNISELRLVQNWFWDDKRKEIHIILEAVAPTTIIFDENGKFDFRLPLFYRFNTD